MSFLATAWDIVREEMGDAALKTVMRQEPGGEPGGEPAPGGGHEGNEPGTGGEHNQEGGEEHEMEPITYFGDLLPLFLFLLAVWTAGRLVKATGGPALVGEIIAGCLLGPQLANYAPEHRGIALVGDMALALLMVEAGLDIDVSLLSQVGPRGLAVAMTGTALPLGLGFGFGMAFGFSWRAALAAGCVLQPTSLAIVLGVLKSGGCLNTPSGQVIVAAAAIDDVIAVVLLSELRALEDLKVLDLLIPVVSAVLLLVIVGFFAIAVVPPLLGKVILPRLPPQHTENVLLMIIFLLAIGLMSIADAVRSSYLLGALMAGLSFSTVHSVHHVWEGQVKRILKWLLKVFFASTIGFEIPIKAFWTGPILGKAAVFSLCVIAKLPVGLYATPLVLPNFLIVGIAMVRSVRPSCPCCDVLSVPRVLWWWLVRLLLVIWWGSSCTDALPCLLAPRVVYLQLFLFVPASPVRSWGVRLHSCAGGQDAGAVNRGSVRLAGASGPACSRCRTVWAVGFDQLCESPGPGQHR